MWVLIFLLSVGNGQSLPIYFGVNHTQAGCQERIQRAAQIPQIAEFMKNGTFYCHKEEVL